MPTRTLAPVLHYLRRMEGESHQGRAADGDLLTRFVRRSDESAFALLLKRHGPMVYGVCRRVLRDRHEAEDAFQATFLILLRKAASLRQPERVGPWLHGVAYRTALKARARAERHSAPLVDDIPAPITDDALWRDLRPVLDRAIDELPVKYRVPFVLCHLQGLTNLQAARQLGCPEGTVATRLSRARARLRTRLAKHGLGVAALGVAVGTAELGSAATTLAAAPPALLVVSTLRIATALRLGASTAVPATVAALITEGVGQAMLITKLRFILALVVLIGTAVGGTAVWSLGAQEPPPAKVIQPPSAVPDQPTAPVAPPAPAVGIPDAQAAMVRTANFIVHAPSRRIAQLVGDAAERLRKSEAIRWLGNELPTWSEPCTLRVSHKDNGLGAATAFQFHDAKVLRRDMTLQGTLDRVLCIGLPHEIAHTILADYFRAPVPRWADEGAAMMAEDAEEQQRHRALVWEIVSDPKRRIPLARLLPMRSFPKDVMALYVEGYALTQFLIAQKDRKTFLAFVKQAMAGDGWDKSVHDYYGFADVRALEETWRARVTKDHELHAGQTDPASQKPAAIKTPAPIIGRARIGPQGRIVVRWPSCHYVPVTSYRKTLSGDAVVPVTSYEAKVIEHVAECALQDMKATDTTGRPIDIKTLNARLRTETPVLIAPGPGGVDPYYLAVMRQDTIVLTPPAGATTLPIAPLPPPPAPVVAP